VSKGEHERHGDAALSKLAGEKLKLGSAAFGFISLMQTSVTL